MEPDFVSVPGLEEWILERPQVLPFLADGIVEATLALVLIRAGLSSRVNRALALYFAAAALATLVWWTSWLPLDPTTKSYWTAVRYYPVFLQFAALAYFLNAYPRRDTIIKTGPKGYAFFAGLVVLPTLLYAWDHSLFMVWSTDSTGAQRLVSAGPLLLVALGARLLFAALPVVFFRLYLAMPVERAGKTALLVASGYTLLGAVVTGTSLVSLATQTLPSGEVTGAWWADALAVSSYVVYSASCLYILSMLVARRTSGSPGGRDRWPTLLSFLIIIGIAFGAVTEFVRAPGGTLPYTVRRFGVYGLFLLSSLLFTYAITRHQLPGMDLRIKWGITRGTVAAAFLATFFVGSQLAEQFFSFQYGWAVGGAAAGLLLFALSPIQRLADRLASATLPQAKAVSDMTHPERVDIFRDQARLVWIDGTIDSHDRRLLDNLRERLGISHQEASRVESEASARTA